MRNHTLLCLAACLAAGWLAGCEKKFTQQRFDTMVIVGQSSKDEVVRVLGEPETSQESMTWKYVDWDGPEMHSATIIFDDNNVVYSKAWTGKDPYPAEPPGRENVNTSTTSTKVNTD